MDKMSMVFNRHSCAWSLILRYHILLNNKHFIEYVEMPTKVPWTYYSFSNNINERNTNTIPISSAATAEAPTTIITTTKTAAVCIRQKLQNTVPYMWRPMFGDLGPRLFYFSIPVHVIFSFSAKRIIGRSTAFILDKSQYLHLDLPEKKIGPHIDKLFLLKRRFVSLSSQPREKEPISPFTFSPFKIIIGSIYFVPESRYTKQETSK